MGNVDCCKQDNQDEALFENNQALGYTNQIQDQQKQQQKSLQYLDYNPTAKIQCCIGVCLSDLTQLYEMFQLLKYQSNNNKMNSTSDQIQDIIFEVNKNLRKHIKTMSIKQTRNQRNQLHNPYFISFLSLKSPAIYIGQWCYESKYLLQNVPYGIGRLYYDNWIYQGSIKTQIHQNVTVQQSLVKNLLKFNRLADRIMYLSNLMTIQLNGEGRKFNKRQEYKGNFKNNLLNGKATYTNHQLQYTYDGFWQDDQRSGKATQKTKFTTYQGQFKHNKKQGNGTLIFYLSQKKQNERQQQLKSRQAIKQDSKQMKQIKDHMKIQVQLQKISQYQILAGIRKLVASYEWKNPFDSCSIKKQSETQKITLKYMQQTSQTFLQKYTGNFTNDKFNQNGNYQWYNGNFYNGQWKSGKMHGIGEFYWKNGLCYKGQYMNDLKHGKGQMVWDPYTRYRGNWAYGNKHGYGEQIKITYQQKSRHLVIIFKGSLYKNNLQQKCYFQKRIEIQRSNQQPKQRQYNLLLTQMQNYSNDGKLARLIRLQLEAEKYNSLPCNICGQYYKKQTIQEDKMMVFKIINQKKDNQNYSFQGMCQKCKQEARDAINNKQ